MQQPHAILAQDHASAWMGIAVQELSEGKAVITMRLREEMLNGFGIAHGGMIFAFADTAFALVCNPAEGRDDAVTVAAGADISFISSGKAGEELTATATVREQFGRSGLYDITVTGEDGRTIAEFRGRSRTIPRR